MQYSIDLGSINKIVGSNTTFKADNKYNNTLIAADTSSIKDNANKIFNTLVILPNANITKTSGSLINQTEFSKYTSNLITDIDIPDINQTLNQHLSYYYKNYYQSLYNKYYNESNLRIGVALHEDNNIVFTNEGDLIIKKPAKLKIYILSYPKAFDTYVTLTVNKTNERYLLAISRNLFITSTISNTTALETTSATEYLFNYLTYKALETNDQILANYYQNRIETSLIYDKDVAKVLFLNDKYISIKTPNKQFTVIALDDLELEESTTINNNFIILTKEGKRVTIRKPFKYIDYDQINHTIPNTSNSLVKVISDNILIDADNSGNIDITGSFISFYNPNSSI